MGARGQSTFRLLRQAGVLVTSLVVQWFGICTFTAEGMIPGRGTKVLNAKVGSQETPGVTGKFGLGIQNEAGQRLIEFCQEIALVITNTFFQQHKRRLYTWTSPEGQHRNQIDCSLQPKMEKLYTVSKNKTRS